VAVVPSSGLLRNLALDDRKLLPGHVAKATSLFGSDAWERIYQARKAQQIDGQEARERYVNLYRWQLERDLGYRRAHPIEVKNNRDRPIYHLIFATDSDPGDKIMSQPLRRGPDNVAADARTGSPPLAGRGTAGPARGAGHCGDLPDQGVQVRAICRPKQP
jgi:hypothetical protein